MIGQVLEGVLAKHAAEERTLGRCEAVANDLQELLADWERGVRGKTSGTHFAAWRRTLLAARHFANMYGASADFGERAEERARVGDAFFWRFFRLRVILVCLCTGLLLDDNHGNVIGWLRSRRIRLFLFGRRR